MTKKIACMIALLCCIMAFSQHGFSMKNSSEGTSGQNSSSGEKKKHFGQGGPHSSPFGSHFHHYPNHQRQNKEASLTITPGAVEKGLALIKAFAAMKYRHALNRYKKGKRATEPLIAKTVVDILRFSCGALSLYNNFPKKEVKDPKKEEKKSEDAKDPKDVKDSKDPWNQVLMLRHTAFWTAIDGIKLLAKIVPADLIDDFFESENEQVGEDIDESFFVWISQQIDDSKFLDLLDLYFLPLFEEAATLYMAWNTGKSGKHLYINMCVAGAKGAVRSINEFLDTQNPTLRGFYFISFLAHAADLAYILSSIQSDLEKVAEAEAKKKQDEETKRKKTNQDIAEKSEKISTEKKNLDKQKKLKADLEKADKEEKKKDKEKADEEKEKKLQEHDEMLRDLQILEKVKKLGGKIDDELKACKEKIKKRYAKKEENTEEQKK